MNSYDFTNPKNIQLLENTLKTAVERNLNSAFTQEHQALLHQKVKEQVQNASAYKNVPAVQARKIFNQNVIKDAFGEIRTMAQNPQVVLRNPHPNMAQQFQQAQAPQYQSMQQGNVPGFSNVMPLPSAQNTLKRDFDFNARFNEIQNQRSPLEPNVPQPVNFEDTNIKNFTGPDVNNEYERMLKERDLKKREGFQQQRVQTNENATRMGIKKVNKAQATPVSNFESMSTPISALQNNGGLQAAGSFNDMGGGSASYDNSYEMDETDRTLNEFFSANQMDSLKMGGDSRASAIASFDEVNRRMNTQSEKESENVNARKVPENEVEMNDYFKVQNIHDQLDTANSYLEKIFKADTTDLIPGKIRFMEDGEDNVPTPIEPVNYLGKTELEERIVHYNEQNAYPVIEAPKLLYKPKKYWITIDSADRDLNLYPQPNRFQVKFAPAPDSEAFQYIVNANGRKIVDEIIRFEGEKAAIIEETYENIKQIRVVNVLLPFAERFVLGTNPYRFNGSKIDKNKVESPNQFQSYSHGIIFEQGLGIRTSILEQPYYILQIPELKGPYQGTNIANSNGFSRLNYNRNFGFYNNFILFDADEAGIFQYDPTLLGKVSLMTMELKTYRNQYVEFPKDKTRVISIEEGDLVTDDCFGNCLKNKHLTKINLEENNNDLSCGHFLRPGDILYFYEEYPCDEAVYLVPGIFAEYDGVASTIRLYAYTENGKEYVSLVELLKGDNQLILNGIYTTKVIFEDGNTTLVIEPNVVLNSIVVNESTKIQVIMKNKRGRTSDSRGRINFKGGYRVCSNSMRDDEYMYSENTVQINFPYEDLPNYLRSSENYITGTLFFIQHRLQWTMEMEIETMEKNSNELNSQILSYGTK